MAQSLCWACKRAVGERMCCWAQRFEPVPGWNAKPREIQGKHIISSFFVLDCPLFERELARMRCACCAHCLGRYAQGWYCKVRKSYIPADKRSARKSCTRFEARVAEEKGGSDE